MKTISWFKSIGIILLLLLCSQVINSQVIVERSKDKVIISGIPYYVHVVKKGETAYSISRAYGLTVEELIKENPTVLYGLNEDQALRIPVSLVRDKVPLKTATVQKPKDETLYIYHSLRPGETIYFLSKSYGVSEDDIIQSNPGIDISNLAVGTEIAVPRRVFMNEREKFNDQEQKYIYHKVIKGETLSSIARKYGMSLRELRRENRDLRFPQVGDFVRVPADVIKPEQEDVIVAMDSVEVIPDEQLVISNRPLDYIKINNLSGSVNVAVLLPFYLKENSVRIEIDSSRFLNGKRIYKENKRDEDWLLPTSIDFVEMYEGILLAADTLRALGLNVNLSAFDIRSDTVDITQLIMSGRLSDMDLIIGPVYSHNLATVASYGKEHGIPVVSPVPLFNNYVLEDNPTLFMAYSSLEVAQKTLARKLSEYYNYNFVFIHADTSGFDQDISRFKNLIFNELSYRLPYDEIKFKEFTFYSRSLFDNDSINRLGHALSEKTKNIIIIASEDVSVISETMGEIHGLINKFYLKVFGYPVLREIENLDPKYYFDLDLLVYSPYWIDYEKEDVKQFNSDFRKLFLTEPFEKSWAWEGYDIAYYFMSGLAIYGNEFIRNPEIHYPDLLQTEFEFNRKEPKDGFENQKLFPIRYTKDHKVVLFQENNSSSRY